MSKVDYTPKNELSVESNGNTISLIDLLAIVRKRWKWGALAGVIAAGLLIAATTSKEKLYLATAALTVELDTANVMDIREVVDTRVTHVNMLNTMMNTHVERLQTLKIAQMVEASLIEEQVTRAIQPYFDPTNTSKSPPHLAPLMLKFMLEVERGDDDESQVIIVHIRHPDPVVAQFLADAYVEQYIAYKSLSLNDSTGAAVQFLSDQVDSMRIELEAQEEALQNYRQEHNLISVQQDSGIVGARLRRLNDALTDARLLLLTVEIRQKQIEAAGDDPEKLVEVPFIGSRVDIVQVYAQLNELRRERQVLDEVYLSKHPKVIENDASIRAVSVVLDNALKQARKQAKSEYESAQTEVATLQQRLIAAEEEVLSSERAMVNYNRMERELEKQREVYDKVMTRYRETSISQQMNLVNVSVLENARLPSQPESISTLQLIAAGVFLIGVCLVGVPLVLELFDGRLSSFRDIEFGLSKPLLGDIRFMPKKSAEDLFSGVLKKDPDLIEAYRAIFSSLRLKHDFSGKKAAFLVTSSIPDEGKSVIVSNLAAMIARHSYRVLVVDCDLRRPTQHTAFGLDNKTGIVNWFEGHPTILDGFDALQDQALGIQQINENLFVLTAGAATGDATEILGDPTTSELFKHLRSQFDVVLFDTPPAGVFPDATLVAESADCSLFVARQFQVSCAKLRYSIGLMDRSKAKVLGVIFNGIKDVNAAVGFGQSAQSYYSLGYEKDSTKYHAHYKRS
ncbi:GumC family protein [Coraliomargarita sp. W4R72]